MRFCSSAIFSAIFSVMRSFAMGCSILSGSSSSSSSESSSTGILSSSPSSSSPSGFDGANGVEHVSEEGDVEEIRDEVLDERAPVGVEDNGALSMTFSMYSCSLPTFPWGLGAAPGATEEAPAAVTGGVEDEGDEDLDDAKVGATDRASAQIGMGWL